MAFSLSNTKSVAAMALDLLPALVLAITFLQSSIDKIVDRRGNESYFREHFARSPFAKFTVPLLLTLTAVELIAGLLSGLGFLQILLGGGRTLAFWGAVLSALTFAMLFMGQRLAKDYVGAANLIPYLLLALFGIYTTQ